MRAASRTSKSGKPQTKCHLAVLWRTARIAINPSGAPPTRQSASRQLFGRRFQRASPLLAMCLSQINEAEATTLIAARQTPSTLILIVSHPVSRISMPVSTMPVQILRCSCLLDSLVLPLSIPWLAVSSALLYTVKSLRMSPVQYAR